MAVVRDFYLGPTHVQIDDQYCVSREEAQEILKNLSKKIQLHMYMCEKKNRLEERIKAEEEGHPEIPEGMEEYLKGYNIKAKDIRLELEYRDVHGRDKYMRGPMSRYLYGELKLLMEKLEKEETA